MAEVSDEEALYGYRRMPEIEVLRAVSEIKDAMRALEKRWDEEVAKYEETIMVRTDDDKSRCLLRRNYPNDAGIVDDTSLFPYHDACYAMLDCYETHNDDFTSDSVDSLLDSADEDDWTNYASIGISLLSLSECPERAEILLRLLKHSLADFQPDHRLTAELLHCARDWKCFQDVQFYRNVIACFLLDRVICNGRCDARRDSESVDDHYDHICDHWQRIELIFGEALCLGLDEFTSEHSLLLCAFFKITLDMANPSAGEKDDEIVANMGSLPSKSRKAKLKQAIYLWKMTDYDNDESDDESEENTIKEIIPYRVMREFVVQLSQYAGKIRHQKLESRPLLNSFCNSIGTLVFIGETSVRRLPAKYDSIEFCSKIVASFVGAYVHNWDYQEADSPYFISPGLPSVISPDRYANAINQATDRFLQEREFERGEKESDLTQTGAYRDTPRVPNDVFDVIKSFFARDLASVDKAGCGYGDCLVWLGGEITGHDPFLFFSDTHNYPVGNDDESEYDDESLVWVYDEVRRHSLLSHLYALPVTNSMDRITNLFLMCTCLHATI